MNQTLLTKLLYSRQFSKSFCGLFSLLIFLTFSINEAIANDDDLGCTMTCIGHVNLSLDSDCESTVTYKSLLADPDNPANCTPNGWTAFKVTVFDLAGNPIGNKVTDANIGQTLEVQVKHYYTGNFCWGTITIEDKVGPWTACVPDVTVGCTESTDPSKTGTPVWTDCSDFTTDYYDQITTKDCPDQISAVIKRTFVATDVNGYSKRCTQNIYIKRSSISAVVGPVNYDGTTSPDLPKLTCGSSIEPEDLPGPRAFPTIDGMAINPSNENCKLGVSYSDSAPIPTCGNGYKVVRDWLIIDWCGGSEKRYTQFIAVGDEVAPTISCQPTISAGTDSGKCSSTVQVPGATVSDDCSSVSVRINTPFGQILTNGGTLNNVPVGSYEITYIARDECGNESSCKSELIVIDDDTPIAICDQSTVVSLSSEATTYVNARVFDSGSYDNCGNVAFVATRTTTFDERVPFTCADADAGVIMVRLRVYEVGNPDSYSECMVEVTVQDKNSPRILTCPSDVTVDCDDLNDDLTAYGAPTFADNCGFEVTPSVDMDINNCGVGTITRSWNAFDENGSVTCKQVITIENRTPFNGDITFPPDVTLTECGSTITEDIIGYPDLPQNLECGQLVVNHVDETFTGGSDACLKIVRRWKVIDWCQYNPAYDPNTGVWIHYQTIKVVDNNQPVLTVSDDIVVKSIENNCATGFVEIPLATADDCNPNVTITNNSPYANSSGANASGRYPYGTTEVTFTANDGCGNFISKKVKISVMDGRKPSPVCLSGVVTEIGQTGEVELWAIDLDASSSDNCTPTDDLIFTIRKHDDTVDDPQPPTTSNLVITCDDLKGSGDPNVAAVPIELWVGDAAGNWDYCLTYIAVQDNMDACPDDAGADEASTMISGKVETPDGKSIGDVDLNLTSNNPAYDKFVAGINGTYVFPKLESGMNYEVNASKSGAYNNGISTYDVLKITRHILGTESFTSPYNIIASDVNGNGKVSTSDVLALRRLILSIKEDFGANQTSWNFIPANHQFSDPKNPLADYNGQGISFTALNDQVYDADFIGVKVGDINGSATSNLLGQDKHMSSADLMIDDQSFRRGDDVEMTIDASKLGSVSGIQFVLEYDDNLLVLDDLPEGLDVDLDASHFNVETPGTIRFSWVGSDAQDLEQLMKITLRAKGTGSLNTTINIKENTSLVAEFYDQASNINGLGLQFNRQGSSLPEFEIYPNPFKESTSITFELSTAQDVTLSILDISGKQIYHTQQSFGAGVQRMELTDNLFKGAGVYFVQLRHAGEHQTKKLVLAY